MGDAFSAVCSDRDHLSCWWEVCRLVVESFFSPVLPNVTASRCNICSGRCFLFAWHYSLHPSTLVFTGEADGKSGGLLHNALSCWTKTRFERTQTSAASLCTERRSSVKSCFLALFSAPVASHRARTGSSGFLSRRGAGG